MGGGSQEGEWDAIERRGLPLSLWSGRYNHHRIFYFALLTAATPNKEERIFKRARELQRQNEWKKRDSGGGKGGEETEEEDAALQ